MATMLAAWYERYGRVADVVELRQIEKPSPGPGELLVRVVTASVNRADIDGLGPRPGFVRAFTGLRAPRSHRIGLDAAGVVESVGPDVTAFKVGDRVFADMFSYGGGAFSEFVTAPEKAFLKIPGHLSFEQAATLPHSAPLAIQGLRRRNGRTIKAGDKVLIDGASGNVGPFALQVAKSRGAEVTGVARTSKLDFVRSLGADHVIDYTKVDYTRERERYDWIVDTDSHHGIRAVRRALAPNGQYVTLGGSSRPLAAAMLVGSIVSMRSDRWSGLMLWWKPFHAPDIEAVANLIAEGKVTPAIDRRFPLTQVKEAMQWMDDGHSKGKVLVTVADG